MKTKVAVKLLAKKEKKYLKKAIKNNPEMIGKKVEEVSFSLGIAYALSWVLGKQEDTSFLVDTTIEKSFKEK